MKKNHAGIIIGSVLLPGIGTMIGCAIDNKRYEKKLEKIIEEVQEDIDEFVEDMDTVFDDFEDVE